MFVNVILRILTMRLVSTPDQRSTQELNCASDQKLTRTLIHRGNTYEVPQQPALCPEPARSRGAQLVGRYLIYRGNTYQVIPLPESRQPATKIYRQLIYRGVSFAKEIEVA
jgi:Domain of unknown function (DUF4278)